MYTNMYGHKCTNKLHDLQYIIMYCIIHNYIPHVPMYLYVCVGTYMYVYNIGKHTGLSTQLAISDCLEINFIGALVTTQLPNDI